MPLTFATRKLLAVTMLAALPGVIATIGTARAEQTFTYSSALPAKHLGNEVGLVPFFATIKEKTGVDWQLHPGGSLGNFKEAFDTVSSRVVDGAAIVDSDARQNLPGTSTLSDLSLQGTDPRVMAAAMNETVMIDRPDLWEEWTSQGVRPMAAYALAPFVLMCADDLRTLDSIQGRKIRATGGFADAVRALGAVPVTIESTEIYEGMRRGQVDCVVASTAWLKSFSLFDVVKSINKEPLGLFFGAWIFAISDDAWNELSDEQKKIHYETIPSLIRRSVEQYSLDGVEVEETSAQKGIEWFQADQAYRDRLDQFRISNVDEVIAKAKERGIADPEGMVAVFMENVEKWNKIVAEAGDDYDAYEQALWTEIFSKVQH